MSARWHRCNDQNNCGSLVQFTLITLSVICCTTFCNMNCIIKHSHTVPGSALFWTEPTDVVVSYMSHLTFIELDEDCPCLVLCSFYHWAYVWMSPSTSDLVLPSALANFSSFTYSFFLMLLLILVPLLAQQTWFHAEVIGTQVFNVPAIIFRQGEQMTWCNILSKEKKCQEQH